MKIRNPWLIRWIALIVAWIIRLWAATLCLRLRALGRNLDPRLPHLDTSCIYAFWHETVFLPCGVFGRRRIVCLISQHADGEIIAQVCHHVGFSVVRGSSTRGGVEALRRMLRASNRDFAVLPDGPRGPRRRLELGLVFLASRTGMPLVLAGIGYDRPWRLPTWDRFAVPRPWSRAVILLSEPMYVPPNVRRDELERFRKQAEDTLNALTEQAERLAEGRRIGYLEKQLD